MQMCIKPARTGLPDGDAVALQRSSMSVVGLPRLGLSIVCFAWPEWCQDELTLYAYDRHPRREGKR